MPTDDQTPAKPSGSMTLAKLILRSAAIFNISGGVAIVVPLDRIGPSTHSDPMLFRLFAGGTAVVFGVGYLAASKNIVKQRLFVSLGAALKYWAFAISVYCFFAGAISTTGLIVFGMANLLFAILFTALLRGVASNR